jgi:hypothetical protein
MEVKIMFKSSKEFYDGVFKVLTAINNEEPNWGELFPEPEISDIKEYLVNEKLIAPISSNTVSKGSYFLLILSDNARLTINGLKFIENHPKGLYP